MHNLVLLLLCIVLSVSYITCVDIEPFDQILATWEATRLPDFDKTRRVELPISYPEDNIPLIDIFDYAAYKGKVEFLEENVPEHLFGADQLQDYNNMMNFLCVLAIVNDQPQVLDFLIEKYGFDFFLHVKKQVYHPAIAAIYNNRYDIVEKYLADRVLLSRRTKSGLTTFCVALQMNNMHAVEELMKIVEVGSTTCKNLNKKPLIYFLENLMFDKATMLVESDKKLQENKPDYNEIYISDLVASLSKFDFEVNGLMQAIYHIGTNKTPDVLSEGFQFIGFLFKLYAKRINVNATTENKETPLGLACLYGLKPIVELLVDHKASINQVYQENDTPLIRAVRSNDFEIVMYLIRKGADLKRDANFCRQILQENPSEKSSELFSIFQLLNSDAAKDDNISRLNLALIAACREADINRVFFLIRGGADVNTSVNGGLSCIFYAVIENNFTLFNALLDLNANLLLDPSGPPVILTMARSEEMEELIRNRLKLTHNDIF